MKKPDKLQRAALNITHWIGSPQSILIHTTLFVIGFSTVLLNVLPLDTLLLILNTIVSLEAIYLALFIQLTVNYTTETIEEVGFDASTNPYGTCTGIVVEPRSVDCASRAAVAAVARPE